MLSFLEIFDEMYQSGKMPSEIVKEKGFQQVNDTNLIEDLCKEAMKNNPKAVEDIKNGNSKAIGALVGFVMKQSKGQANPSLINEILEKLLK